MADMTPLTDILNDQPADATAVQNNFQIIQAYINGPELLRADGSQASLNNYSMGGSKIINMAGGTEPGDAVNRSQLDALVPSGAIWEFGGTAAPTGWLLCNGAVVARSTYPNLFAAISTRFWDGTTSVSPTQFQLPNFSGRAGVGVGSGQFATVGARGGEADTALPTHTHSVPAHVHSGPSHTHTTSAHVHTETSHTHTGGAHTHGVGAHSHTFSGTASTDNASHSHGLTGSVTDNQTDFVTRLGSFTNGGFASGRVVNASTTAILEMNTGLAAPFAGMAQNFATSHGHNSTFAVSTGNASHSHTLSGSVGGGSGTTSPDGAVPTGNNAASETGSSGFGSTSAAGTENTGAAGPVNTIAAGVTATNLNYSPYVVVTKIIKI
jgi:microcystin-dependent protein